MDSEVARLGLVDRLIPTRRRNVRADGVRTLAARIVAATPSDWAYLRHRADLLQHRATYVQHMQKNLQQMNIQLAQVLSDITGETGLAIVRAIGAVGPRRKPSPKP